MSENSKLLEPLSTVVAIALRVLVGVVVVGFVLSLFHTGIHVGWGRDACVSTDWLSESSSGAAAEFGAKAGAVVDATPRYCASDPSTYQSALGALGELPSFVFLMGGLFVLNGVLRTATREGVYTLRTAARLRLLGWWLLLGGLIAEGIEAGTKTALLSTLATDVPSDAWLAMWSTPYFKLFAALGLIAFARVMRVGVAMREDLDGTV